MVRDLLTYAHAAFVAMVTRKYIISGLSSNPYNTFITKEENFFPMYEVSIKYVYIGLYNDVHTYVVSIA
jgi:hypothetical protein